MVALLIVMINKDNSHLMSMFAGDFALIMVLILIYLGSGRSRRRIEKSCR